MPGEPKLDFFIDTAKSQSLDTELKKRRRCEKTALDGALEEGRRIVARATPKATCGQTDEVEKKETHPDQAAAQKSVLGRTPVSPTSS